MNMNVKGFIALSMVTTMAGASLFAAPKAVEKTSDKKPVQKIEIQHDEKKPDSEKNQIQVISGKVSVTEKKGLRTVYFQSKDGKTYILTNDANAPTCKPGPEMDKKPAPDEKRPEMKDDHGDKNGHEDGRFAKDDRKDGRFENAPRFEKVSMDTLASKKNIKQITLSGFVNEESGVFTVIKIGNINEKPMSIGYEK